MGLEWVVESSVFHCYRDLSLVLPAVGNSHSAQLSPKPPLRAGAVVTAGTQYSLMKPCAHCAVLRNGSR